MDIREVLNRPEYDFIKTNPHLGGSMIFATFGGSHAYGTNTPDSDIDVRGCALNSRTDILGRTNFEQVIDNATDTTIYSFNKLIHLLSDCNPNTIELLGCKPEQYVFFNDIGRMMVEQRDMFLSQKAVHAFGGYATQQLRRLQAALARDRYDQSEKEKQILSSCKSSMTSFNDRYQEFENGAIHLYVDESQREDLDTEIFLDVNLTHYPLRDYKNIWSDLNTIVKEYGKITQRNKKKDDAHLNKHANPFLPICTLLEHRLGTFHVTGNELNNFRPVFVLDRFPHIFHQLDYQRDSCGKTRQHRYNQSYPFRIHSTLSSFFILQGFLCCPLCRPHKNCVL